MVTQVARLKKTTSARNNPSAARLTRDLAYLSRHSDELHEQFANQFVAISDEKVVGHARDVASLKHQLRQMGLEAGNVLIHFLTDAKTTLVF